MSVVWFIGCENLGMMVHLAHSRLLLEELRRHLREGQGSPQVLRQLA